MNFLLFLCVMTSCGKVQYNSKSANPPNYERVNIYVRSSLWGSLVLVWICTCNIDNFQQAAALIAMSAIIWVIERNISVVNSHMFAVFQRWCTNRLVYYILTIIFRSIVFLIAYLVYYCYWYYYCSFSLMIMNHNYCYHDINSIFLISSYISMRQKFCTYHFDLLNFKLKLLWQLIWLMVSKRLISSRNFWIWINNSLWNQLYFLLCYSHPPCSGAFERDHFWILNCVVHLQ